MTILMPDEKIRTIKLTGDELGLLIDFIKSRFSMDDYEFLKKIIDKLELALNDAKEKKEAK